MKILEKNILLIFLSPVKAKDGKISETHYKNLDGENTHTTNESAVRYLLKNISADAELSKIFILASKAVRENIENYSEKITHLEYFKNRMKKFLPNVENCITEETIYNYNEDNDGEENLKSVAEMARHGEKQRQNYFACRFNRRNASYKYDDARYNSAVGVQWIKNRENYLFQLQSEKKFRYGRGS